MMSENILVVYYSWSGNTRKIAETIGKQTGGSLFELIPVNPYPENYSACTTQARKEIRAGVIPELTAIPDIPESCDTVFIGSPNWWSTMAPPVSAFLSTVDLSGKNIVPFFSHGGGGAGHYVKDIEKSCPDSTVLEPLILTGSGGGGVAERIASCLQKLGLS